MNFAKNLYMGRLLLLALLVVLFTPSQSLAVGKQDTAISHFANASRIKIKFLGYAELTGDYLVDDNKVITIPVLGRFSLEKLSGSDLEMLLAEKTSSITNRDAYVSVEILEYKPFFVTGHVMQPGSKQWRPGMTVFHAISISGGFYRNNRSTEAAFLLRAVESEVNILRRSTSNLKLTMAELARLEAEVADSNITLSPSLVDLVGQLEAQSLIDYQATILNRDREAFETQISLFRRGITEANNRIESLEQQKTLSKQQLELRRTMLEGIKSLWKNKTVNSNRLMTEQMAVMTIESQIANINVSLSTARSRKIALEQEIGRFKLRREQTITARIVILQREIAQLRIDIDAAQVAYRRLTGQSSVNSTSRQPVLITYNIIRQIQDRTDTIEASENTNLLPGDILVVKNSTAGSNNPVLNSQTARQLGQINPDQ